MHAFSQPLGGDTNEGGATWHPPHQCEGKAGESHDVYFSVESSVMVQISEHCHTSITHPMLDAKQAERTQQNWKIPGKTIVAAAE